MASHLLAKYILDKLLLKEFAFQLFEIVQTIELIRRKLKAWPELPVPMVPYQLLNHGHARKEMEGYLDYRWMPATIQRHHPKGLITTHFRRLGLTITYRHETRPEDFLFEDVKGFEEAIVRMCLKHIPEERITTLGQDPEVDRLEWQR